VIDTLAVDGWAVTFGTARRGLGGAAQASLNMNTSLLDIVAKMLNRYMDRK